MMMCTRCKKRPAVVFISQLNVKDPDSKKNQGLCLVCAKELGISQQTVIRCMERLAV